MLDGLLGVGSPLVDDGGSAQGAPALVIVHFCLDQLAKLRKQLLERNGYSSSSLEAIIIVVGEELHFLFQWNLLCVGYSVGMIIVPQDHRAKPQP